ncbi:hypothetical protein DH2020_041725 [Rehmannia glutinosa]|uniref:Uncharacterized protein n=1 Tax=Rehmannia glutinosa TaxID=99300 RepID=A0ABR0UQE7_REHGL
MDEQNPQSTVNIVIDPSITTKNPQERENNYVTKEPSSVLTRLHAGYFRICLSMGGQVLLWSTLTENANQTHAFHEIFHSHTLPSMAFLLLWWLSFCTLLLLSSLYILRCVFHFRQVKAEFLHHVGVNFLFIPWISWLLLLQAMPSTRLMNFPSQILTWVFVIPVVVLDIKIYGQWFTTEKRFLSMVANPTSQLSVIGNLVGAWAAARMGWKESAVSIFTLGLAHYLVVFITLYQRLSGANRFPAMLRPDFSCLWLRRAWRICRPALFKKSMKRFNIAWWAYSFPLTFLALASVEYAAQVKDMVASTLMLILSALSVLVFIGIMLFTAANTDMLLRENEPCHYK